MGIQAERSALSHGRYPQSVVAVLAMCLGRWVTEDLHSFAKQSLKVENIRALTWN